MKQIVVIGGGAAGLMASVDVYKRQIQIFRDVSFNYVSIQTGSGFAVSDYDLWPAAAQMMLFICTFFGGCSGSTTVSYTHLDVYKRQVVYEAKQDVEFVITRGDDAAFYITGKRIE